MTSGFDSRMPENGGVVIRLSLARKMNFDMSRLERLQKRTGAESPLNDLARLRNLAEERPVGVALVSGPETTGVSDSIEALLLESDRYTCTRFEYQAVSGIKPCGSALGDLGDPDVVMVTLGTPQATDLKLLFASLRRAFPERSVLATATKPDSFNIYQALEIGASDFLLPPFRRSELLTRLVRRRESRGGAESTCVSSRRTSVSSKSVARARFSSLRSSACRDP